MKYALSALACLTMSLCALTPISSEDLAPKVASVSQQPKDWMLGPFRRLGDAKAIVTPNPSSVFFCPLQQAPVTWQSDHTFNPSAIVYGRDLYLLYRAEDASGQGIGHHTSRLGLAKSRDGIHFEGLTKPVLYPDCDGQCDQEWPGGCEDPRLIQKEDGSFVLYYTQWNRKIALLAVATSHDLLHWQKHGYVFEKAQRGMFGKRWSKSGSVITQRVGDQLIATKIQGKYWMFWGEGAIYAATSEDLIQWEPVVDDKGEPQAILQTRRAYFDSELVEAGPPAILTDKGIVLLYNGKNSQTDPDPQLPVGAYCAGQALLNPLNPTQVLERCEKPFMVPEMEFEKNGQYPMGTVFIEALVPFQGKWLLYYGAADSYVGVSIAEL